MAAIVDQANGVNGAVGAAPEAPKGPSKEVQAKEGISIPFHKPIGSESKGTEAPTIERDLPTGPQTERGTGVPYDPVVQRLVDWLNEKELMDDLEDSLKKALSYNISTFRHLEINSIKSFLDYVNALLRWIPEEDFSGKDVYHHIVCFYFVFNQKPISKKQTAIKPKNYGRMSWLSEWFCDYAERMGEWMDTEKSWTEKSMKTFKKSPLYKWDNYIEPRGGWKTFNQFFARNYKPGFRTIYGLNDDSVITAPADCTFGGSWTIDNLSHVTIKHLTWTISELLNGSDYASHFQGGIFTHSFLNTFDYHRLHTPVRGRVLESRVIQGQCFLETRVQKGTESGDDGDLVAFRSVDAPDNPGYQFMQARGLVILDSPIGLVAVLPMGMAQVSSVLLTAEVGVSLRKGEEIGYFQFGGSDIVMVFQAQSRVALTCVPGIHLSLGFQIGTAKVQP